MWKHNFEIFDVLMAWQDPNKATVSEFGVDGSFYLGLVLGFRDRMHEAGVKQASTIDHSPPSLPLGQVPIKAFYEGVTNASRLSVRWHSNRGSCFRRIS